MVGRCDWQVPLLGHRQRLPCYKKPGSSLLTNTIVVKGRVFPKRSVGIILLNQANRVNLDKGENSGVVTYHCLFFFSLCFLKRVENRKSKKILILLVDNDRDSLCCCAMPNIMVCYCSPLYCHQSVSCVLQNTKLKIWHCDTVPRKKKASSFRWVSFMQSSGYWQFKYWNLNN